MTEAIHRMLVTGAILRNPLLVSTSAQHAEDDSTISLGEKIWFANLFRKISLYKSSFKQICLRKPHLTVVYA